MQIIHQEEQQFYHEFVQLAAELECGRHYDPANTQHVAWLRHRIASLYQASAHAICLYTESGEPVGFLLLQHDRGLEGVRCFGKKGTIVMFGLFEGYRSQGLGVQLLRQAEQHLKAEGGECLYVDTYAANAGAIRFYVREGFVPVAYHPGENGRGDLGQVYLHKDLA
jgi:ribosomal protein S18 acetylase RimI-like enzyme